MDSTSLQMTHKRNNGRVVGLYVTSDYKLACVSYRCVRECRTNGKNFDKPIEVDDTSQAKFARDKPSME